MTRRGVRNDKGGRDNSNELLLRAACLVDAALVVVPRLDAVSSESTFADRGSRGARSDALERTCARIRELLDAETLAHAVIVHERELAAATRDAVRHARILLERLTDERRRVRARRE